jgi:cytoskeletal protein CcmA (bactofilin family)
MLSLTKESIAAHGAPHSGVTIIADGSSLTGELKVLNKVHIDGEVQANIIAYNKVSIGIKGIFKGNIQAKHVVINGSCEGTIHSERVEIMSSGKVIGEIKSEYLVIEKNAHFIGNKT